MSRGARWTLGLAMLLIASGFAAIPLSFPAQSPGLNLALDALAGFSALIAVACFSRTFQPVAVRIIASTVLAASVWYLGVQVSHLRSIADALAWDHNKPGLINSVLFFLTFGMLAGYVTWTGRYPSWGEHSGAFGGKEVAP